MLRAIIFDFNGVILNDEPLHFQSMRDAVARIGIRITKEEYWDRYLPLDDQDCLEAICRNHSVQLNAAEWEETLNRKFEYYDQLLQGQYSLFPGATELIRAAAQRYPLALASGASRKEIENTLRAANLDSFFVVVVAAEDFILGKPNPESFLLALERLNAHIPPPNPPVKPGECLVIEDAEGGVQGARAAGMLCLAVSNTYPAKRLQAANRIVSSLEEVDIDSLESLFRGMP